MQRPRTAPKPKKSVALSGVVAGNTALCTVGRTGNDLHYRGYDILDIADDAASSRRSPTCWCTASCRPRPSSPPTRRKLQALRGLPAAGEGRRSSAARRRASDGRDAHRLSRRSAACCRRRTTTTPPGARDIADRLMASLRLDAALLVPLQRTTAGASTSRPTTIPSAGISCTCCTASRRRAVGARDAHLADPLRRARVQRLHVHRARDRRHRLGHLFRHHRRHRRAARAEARRRQRGRVRDPAALRHAGRGRGRHPRARREQGSHHRLRPPGLHGRRSAQPGDQGGRAASCPRTRAT